MTSRSNVRGKRGRKRGRPNGPGRNNWSRGFDPIMAQPRRRIRLATEQSIALGTGIAYDQVSYFTNSTFSVTPGSPGTQASFIGETSAAALYAYYRVIGYEWELTMINNFTSPIACYVTEANINPPVVATLQNYASLPFGQKKRSICKGRNG